MFKYRSKVLAVLNQKGGVGKTTTVTMLSEYGAMIQKVNGEPCRILVVDLDMQCNTSDYFVGMEPAPQERGGQLPPKHTYPEFMGSDEVSERSTIADIFYGQMVLPHTVELSGGTLDVLLGHPRRLEEINEKFSNEKGEVDTNVVNRLGEVLHSEEVAESYDLIILDTGPTRNPIFRAALRAATHVLIPYEPEEKSLQGINSMAQALNSENYSRKKNEPPVKVIGLLPNKVRVGLALHKDNIDTVSTNLPKLAMPEDVFLPLSIAFPKRDVKGANPKSIFDVKKSDNARKHALRVAEHVFGAIFEVSGLRTDEPVRASEA
jgi:chromosome partitioning protein